MSLNSLASVWVQHRLQIPSASLRDLMARPTTPVCKPDHPSSPNRFNHFNHYQEGDLLPSLLSHLIPICNSQGWPCFRFSFPIVSAPFLKLFSNCRRLLTTTTGERQLQEEERASYKRTTPGWQSTECDLLRATSLTFVRKRRLSVRRMCNPQMYRAHFVYACLLRPSSDQFPASGKISPTNSTEDALGSMVCQ